MSYFILICGLLILALAIIEYLKDEDKRLMKEPMEFIIFGIVIVFGSIVFWK